MQGLGLRIWGLGYKVCGLGSKVQGSGHGVEILEVRGSGFRGYRI